MLSCYNNNMPKKREKPQEETITITIYKKTRDLLNQLASEERRTMMDVLDDIVSEYVAKRRKRVR